MNQPVLKPNRIRGHEEKEASPLASQRKCIKCGRIRDLDRMEKTYKPDEWRCAARASCRTAWRTLPAYKKLPPLVIQEFGW